MLRRRWPTEFLIELLSLFAQPVSVIGKNGKNLRKKSGNAVNIQLASITAYPLNNWRRSKAASKGGPGSLVKPSDRGRACAVKAAAASRMTGI
ncbi:hypothetical protein BHU62_09595 [Serratia marcescens]|uniref:Uncharacterized protein n=1 Tax=Serratia marcescens TaxID=615 RepID=A0A1Q4P188_SERMA|nr:hypothetical protein BHU62_09595 [Serratia marcescens]